MGEGGETELKSNFLHRQRRTAKGCDRMFVPPPLTIAPRTYAKLPSEEAFELAETQADFPR